MKRPCDTRQRVLDLTEKMALALRRCVAMRDISDPAVWRLARTLERVGSCALDQLEESEPTGTEPMNLTPDAAIEHLLHRVRRLRGNPS